jgi:hypothetical protein
LRNVRRRARVNGKNRAAFLATRDQARRALDDGWSILSIRETLHEEGKIAFSYRYFAGYVKRLIVRPRQVMEIAATGKKKRRESEPERLNSVNRS